MKVVMKRKRRKSYGEIEEEFEALPLLHCYQLHFDGRIFGSFGVFGDWSFGAWSLDLYTSLA
jgi:hypothetical protein